MNTSLYPWLVPHWERLQQQFARGRFAHGLLLAGPAGIGKEHLLHALAGYMLCHARSDSACGQCSSCQLVEAGTHPDLLILGGSNKTIGVDEVRATIQMLSERAHQQGARVVIVHGAQKMTENAANALLKTLEEPGEESYLLLDAVSSGELLATITSRCQVEHMAEPDPTTALRWLKTQQPQAELMHLKINRGSPLNVLAFFDNELNVQCQSFIHRLNLLLRSGAIHADFVQQCAELGSTALDWLWFYLADLQKAKAGLPAQRRIFVEHAAEQDSLIAEVDFNWIEAGIHALSEWRRTLAMAGINQPLQIRAALSRWCELRKDISI